MKSSGAYCDAGAHRISLEAWFYTINPEGGYGRSEFLCCAACIWKPENKALRERMLEAGAKELA